MRQKTKSKYLERFLSDWSWVCKVINSCTTIAQLNNANKLRTFLDSKYNKRVDTEQRRRVRTSLFNRYLKKYDDIKNS